VSSLPHPVALPVEARVCPHPSTHPPRSKPSWFCHPRTHHPPTHGRRVRRRPWRAGRACAHDGGFELGFQIDSNQIRANRIPLMYMEELRRSRFRRGRRRGAVPWGRAPRAARSYAPPLARPTVAPQFVRPAIAGLATVRHAAARLATRAPPMPQHVRQAVAARSCSCCRPRRTRRTAACTPDRSAATCSPDCPAATRSGGRRCGSHGPAPAARPA
jgi:hypothetical protein